MIIRLWNTATKTKEALPDAPHSPSMYVCGPTVYDRAHLGNARPAVVFDVLFRLLRHAYGAGSVTYVRNITDIDDKINARAAETGRPIAEITGETTRWYLDDMAALGVAEPSAMPRATAYVPQMVAMIAGLIDAGHAYAAEGHVLFRVRSDGDYGTLSGRALDDMIAGARVEVAPYKEDPLDFVLWKPSSDDLPGWDSPWGRGRPGWHIECSAMAADLLGETFDIHGGGIDLQFPHHENELAQSRGMGHPFDIHGGGIDLQFPHHENELAQSRGMGHPFARIWMHNEMLQVDGRKMSKSLGNFFTVRDLLDRGIPGEVIRFVLLSTHYRKPMDWTAEKAQDARRRLARWYRRTDGVTAGDHVPEAVVAALADDLNTHLALSEMDRMGARPLTAAMRLLGFPPAAEVDWFREDGAASGGDALAALLDRWQGLRAARDFAGADALKAELEALGLKLSIRDDGPTATVPAGFDPARLAPLLEEGR